MTQGPYHLISLGLLLILSYLAGLLLVRFQLISRIVHRRFWNTLLLLFFVSTALFGLFLAIKVNYKLNVPWIEKATQWHVDLGIGFALISLFHLFWHLGYFKKVITERAGPSKGSRLVPYLSLRPLQVNLFFVLLGFISIISQLVLLREFIKTLHGNELVIGIFLAIWMVLTSAGAWAGSGYNARVPGGTLFGMLLILAALPMVIHLILILITRIVFLPGYEPGMIASITYIVILIGIYTLVSGFLFAYFARVVKQRVKGSSYYMLDSLGSLAGGFLFGLILVLLLDNIQVMACLFLLTSLGVTLLFDYPGGWIRKGLLLVSGVLLFTVLLLPQAQNALEGLRYKNERILETRDTPYGNLTFTEKDSLVTGYLDRNPVLTSADLVRAEETVHYPALQHPDPASFLLLGGGRSGNIGEIAKYKPEIFDYCEADPEIYELSTRYLPPVEPEMFRFIPEDGRSWLSEAGDLRYDVIISAAGDPYTLGWNRYYTEEFYKMVRRHLSPGGVFGMQLSVGGNYVDDPGGISLSINYNTLKQIFDNVIVVPGYATYFVASRDSLTLDYPALLKEHNIATTYVHPDYLDLTRLTFDSDQLTERILQEDAPVNRDLWPRLFFSSLAHLEARMGGHSLLAAGIISMLLFLVLLFSYKPLSTGMFVSGFTGAGIQILLIMTMQSFYGYAYQVTPLMITIFMAGIVAGSYWWRSIWRNPSLTKFTGLLWIMAITAAAGVVLLKNEQLFTHRWPGIFILGFINLVPGMVVGSVYGMSIALSDSRDTSGIGRFYSADLAGAALGTFIPAVIILPLIGVTNSFILFCGFNVAAGLYILTRWR